MGRTPGTLPPASLTSSSSWIARPGCAVGPGEVRLVDRRGPAVDGQVFHLPLDLVDPLVQLAELAGQVPEELVVQAAGLGLVGHEAEPLAGQVEGVGLEVELGQGVVEVRLDRLVFLGLGRGQGLEPEVEGRQELAGPVGQDSRL